MSTGYNLATIRRLLLAAFSAEELPRFCRDTPQFEPVCNRFGPRYGFDDMVDELLEYARTHGLLGELLAAVRAHNPGQYAAFQPQLTAVEDEGAAVLHGGAPIRRRAWVLLALLIGDLGLLLVSGWCLFGHDPALVAYVQTAATIVGVLVAIAAVVLAVRRPATWDAVLHLLGTERHWSAVVGLVTVACVAAVVFFCLNRPPQERPPTAYMALIVDNGPVPAEHDFEELRAAVQVELAHALPNAALALHVFGLNCGYTRQLVDFETGNAREVADALGGVQQVARSDLSEAVRQALDNLLAPAGSQPRVLVVVTWGQDGCGGDLDSTLARYREQLGGVVSMSLIAVGEPPAMATYSGVNVVEVRDVQEALDALHGIHRALETGTRTPVFRATLEPTP